MDTEAARAYDDVLYPALALEQTHPDRLATQARLLGMHPAPVERCRVLELGCGAGGNLIPMALAFPESRFVGIDLAARPIDQAVALASALGAANIKFMREDITDVTEDLGRFDYVIAHGLYSWVPSPVRDRILSLTAETLSPHGVAYVSYNTYPGCHLRHTVREMLRFHVRGVTDSAEKITRARRFAQFLMKAHEGPTLEQTFMREELAQIDMNSDGSLFHDDLADINAPVYFHEFAAHAARHGLQYLGEANMFQMHDRMYAAEVRETLSGFVGDDVLLKEQYLDFMSTRRFRQTLLCRDDVKLDRTPAPSLVEQFHFAGPVRPVSANPDLVSPTVVEEFRGRLTGAAVSTDLPLGKAALRIVGERWPEALSFDVLLATARDRLGSKGTAVAGEDEALCGVLLGAYYAGLVELHGRPPQFCLEPGPRPTASPLVRLQVKSGIFVTNLRHVSIKIEDDIGRHLIALLDGSRDRATLRAALQRYAASRVTSPRGAAVKVEPAAFDGKLRELGRLALLVA
jgi:methyltransferase-like protein/2-polyprenyl-3-methyl-5-hydroxy-6-metoxy-1,4-benzoquinol methylase